MRTTIELPDDLRAQLLSLAARRGEKGFSGLIEVAVERYLADERGRRSVIRSAVSALGKLSPEDAKQMRASIQRLRASWRTS